MAIGHNGGPTLDDDRAGNWFAVSRDIFDHPVVGIRNRAYTELEAWLSLLAMAEYENRRVMNKGAIIVLDPGQLMAAHAFLAKRWTWHPSKVRRFLDLLMREAMITRFCNMLADKRGDNQIQILTICNYAKYQLLQDAERQANEQPARQAADKQATSGRQASDNNLTLKHSNTEDSHGDPELFADAESKPTKKPYGDALSAFNAYNDAALRCGLPQSARMTPTLRAKIAARLKDHGLDGWMRALGCLEKSAFLCGDNDSGFRASLTWICKPEKFENLVSGVYGNGRHRPGAGPTDALRQIDVIVGRRP